MIILLLLLVSILMAATDLPDFSADIAGPFQKICISLSPQSTKWSELYAATICGQAPSNSELMWDFRNTGLYHLIVVSGAHLSFVATLATATLSKVPNESLNHRFRRRFIIFVLGLYALASGLNPPVCRALIGFLIARAQKRNHLGWSPYSVVVASGLVCLIAFPSWWRSLSFQMSWLASLAIVLPGSLFQKSLYCYVFMLLPMSVFQWNHPATVVFNFLLAPVLGFIVLPFSILPFFIPPLLAVSDWAWELVVFVVQACSRFVSSTQPNLRVPIALVWITLFSLHLFFHHYEIRTRRREWRNQ